MYSIGNKDVILDVLFGLTPQHIVILPHVRTDPDALGCSAGMADFLMQLGHDVLILIDEEAADDIKFIYDSYPLQVFSKEKLEQMKEPGLFIFLDHHSPKRLDQREILVERYANVPFLIIDHHLIADDSEENFLQNEDFAGREVYAWIDSKRSSVSEMVAELFLEENLKLNDDYFNVKQEITINEKAAKALLSGIYGDTDGLRFSNSSDRTFYICSKLKLESIEIDKIADALFGQKRLQEMQMIGDIYQQAKLNQQKNMIWFTVTPDFLAKYQATQNDLEGVCSAMRNIENIDLAILIRQVDNTEIRVNLRSNEHFNSRDLAFVFGGGGHARAAGITFKGEKDLAQVEAKIIAEATKMFAENQSERN